LKRFYCLCGQEIFVNNAFCDKCGRDLIFDPMAQTMWSGVLMDNQFIAHTKPLAGESPAQKNNMLLHPCSNRYSAIKCNWSTSSSDDTQCISCKSTRMIPDQNDPKNAHRWMVLERAKRQLFMTLLSLKLPIEDFHQTPGGLAFEFLEDKRSNPNIMLDHVLTGHSNGTITLNAAEADEGFLHVMKEQMGETYRTILGHFRHEVGHYYWGIVINDDYKLSQFRELFGDERQDYGEALERYYNQPKRNFKSSQFITQYASSHPLEDWAESWAHYLHIVDTLETAVSYGLSAYEPKINDFDNWYSEWARVAQTMNALNRSMGLSDAYPFILTEIVRAKLHFIDYLIDGFAKKG